MIKEVTWRDVQLNLKRMASQDSCFLTSGQKTIWLGLFDEGDLVGCIGLKWWRRAGKCTLRGLWVKPGHRGDGNREAYVELLKAAAAKARKLGCLKCEVRSRRYSLLIFSEAGFKISKVAGGVKTAGHHFTKTL